MRVVIGTLGFFLLGGSTASRAQKHDTHTATTTTTSHRNSRRIAEFAKTPEEVQKWEEMEERRERLVDHRGLHRRQLYQEGVRLSEAQGVTVLKDYEARRRRIDLNQPPENFFPAKQSSTNNKNNNKNRELGGGSNKKKEDGGDLRMLNDEALSFWNSLLGSAPVDGLESSMMMSMVPTHSPTTETPNTPIPTPHGPTPVPTPDPTPVPTPNAPSTPTSPTSPQPSTLSPTASPSMLDPTPPPTLSPAITPTTPSPVPPTTPQPVLDPTQSPTLAPAIGPTTLQPVLDPTRSPTLAPAIGPTTPQPVLDPTRSPTLAPAIGPTTPQPVLDPTPSPTRAPIVAPTTPAPIVAPTTPAPIVAPTTPAPVVVPTTSSPTRAPVPAPTTPAPVVVPTTVSPTACDIVPFIINEVSINGAADFENPESYQSKALDWLCTDPGRVGLSDERVAQRWVMACFYYATYEVSTLFTDAAFGDGVTIPWFDSNGWLTAADECTWDRILCDTQSRIWKMDMFANALTGSMPPELIRFQDSLELLDLGTTYVLASPEFNTYLGQLTSLTDLRYEECNFISLNGVPTEIGNLKQLDSYGATNVLYSGALQAAAFPLDMTRLKYIEIEFNTFNSTIPVQLGSLPALQAFYIRGCDMKGDLSFMQAASLIVDSWVDINPGLTGPLPAFLGNLNSLGSFSLSECSFSGTLPADIGSPSSITSMFLSDNPFTGTLPSEYGTFGQLEALTVLNTGLTGTIPTQICLLRAAKLEIFEAPCSMCATANPIGGRPCCTNEC